jgi:hypothetical protein
VRFSGLKDFVLRKSDGTPSYNFAAVVDDAEMGITHVIRGEEHLSNTGRQALLYRALGRTNPGSSTSASSSAPTERSSASATATPASRTFAVRVTYPRRS